MRPSSLALLVPAWLLLACGPQGVAPIPADSSTTRASTTSGAASASGAPSANGTTTSASAEGGPAASGSAAAPKSPAIEADPAMAEKVAALVKDPPHPGDDVGAGFLGPVDPKLDAEWITRMASAEIAEITPNKGGGSVSMRVKFKDGKKAALKAEQTGHPTDPRSEIAAYHLDRLLGFGRTAPVVGRRFDMAKIRAALVASKAEPAFLDRLEKLVVRDGHLDAALIAWHTAPLVEEEVAPAWIAPLADKDPVEKDMLPKLKDWSDLVVFDFLVDNPDRYSGGNILRLDKGGPIVFLDQGAAFGRGRLQAKQTTMDRLQKVCRFRRETLSALKKVGSAAGKDGSLGALLAKSLAKDPLSPVLDEAQIRGVDERVKMLEAHVKACSAKVGAAVLLSAAP